MRYRFFTILAYLSAGLWITVWAFAVKQVFFHNSGDNSFQ